MAGSFLAAALSIGLLASNDKDKESWDAKESNTATSRDNSVIY